MPEIALRSLAFVTVVSTCLAGFAQDKSGPAPTAKDAHQSAEHTGPACLQVDHFFTSEVWAKVGERSCLKCHNAKGDASDSKFLLLDPVRDQTARNAAMRHNRQAFQQMAKAVEAGKTRMLQKISGGLDHGGGEVIRPE